MPRVSDIALFRQTEQPTLVVRTHAAMKDLPRAIGESYAKIAAYLCELGEVMADIPFVGYHSLDMQNLDVEIGFPLARPVPGKDDIQAGSLPDGLAVSCIYRGPYWGMKPVYGEMNRFIEASGYEATGAAYEHYFNGPKRAPWNLLTKVVMPVRQK